MKILNKSIYIVLISLLTVFSACDLDEVVNPNGPTIESFENGATDADIKLLVSGLESVMRNDMEFYYETVAIVGREYYDLNNVDPRYTGELLGAQGAQLDNNGFLTTRSFTARYKTIKTANLLLTALENGNVSFSDAESAGIGGYAKTIMAYAYLLTLNRQYENGIRPDVADPDNLGPFTPSYDDGLSAIQSMIDDANNELGTAGTDFAFSLSSGFTGFDDVASFRTFNRAIAARVALYQGNMTLVRSLIAETYMDMAGNLYDGPQHYFGVGGNEIANPLFYIPDQDLYGAHDSFVADAEAGDTRVTAKTRRFLDEDDNPTTITADGLSTDYQVNLYNANTDAIGIIRNEELILIWAEANVGFDNAEAEAAINVIRNAAGLADYAGGTTDPELIDEILVQRRYSLFGEGHRWVDMRRFGRLDELPLDRAGDIIHVEFPRPVLEVGQ